RPCAAGHPRQLHLSRPRVHAHGGERRRHVGGAQGHAGEGVAAGHRGHALGYRLGCPLPREPGVALGHRSRPANRWRDDPGQPAALRDEGMESKVYPSFEAAMSDIRDGASIMVAGFGPGTPHNLMKTLYDMGTKDLTLIANSIGGGSG